MGLVEFSRTSETLKPDGVTKLPQFIIAVPLLPLTLMTSFILLGANFKSAVKQYRKNK